jgi:hypothetical protein
MLRRTLLIAGIASLIAGCESSLHPISRVAPAPETVQLMGVVRYPGGAVVPLAFVSVLASATDTTSADSMGVFHLAVPFGGDSLLLAAYARPLGGITVGTAFTYLRLLPDKDRVLNVVLDRFQPI